MFGNWRTSINFKGLTLGRGRAAGADGDGPAFPEDGAKPEAKRPAKSFRSKLFSSSLPKPEKLGGGRRTDALQDAPYSQGSQSTHSAASFYDHDGEDGQPRSSRQHAQARKDRKRGPKGANNNSKSNGSGSYDSTHSSTTSTSSHASASSVRTTDSKLTRSPSRASHYTADEFFAKFENRSQQEDDDDEGVDDAPRPSMGSRLSARLGNRLSARLGNRLSARLGNILKNSASDSSDSNSSGPSNVAARSGSQPGTGNDTVAPASLTADPAGAAKHAPADRAAEPAAHSAAVSSSYTQPAGTGAAPGGNRMSTRIGGRLAKRLSAARLSMTRGTGAPAMRGSDTSKTLDSPPPPQVDFDNIIIVDETPEEKKPKRPPVAAARKASLLGSNIDDIV